MYEDLRYIKTEELIQQSLILLLKTHYSIEKITVKDICAHARIGRSTFYTHYLDKFDLFEKTIKVYTISFETLLSQRFLTNDISESIKIIVTELNKNRTEITTLIHSSFDQYDLEKNFQFILKKHCVRYVQRISKYKSFSLPIPFIVELYTANSMSVINYSLENETSDDIFSFLHKLFDNGLKYA
ncbi:TetR/AcrR family transcriptional regulator [Enterococcus sp. AZ101]|uniref:TetR/AcrR family transcriptional regulator n=1 Tax=Enterococcus sp. AZ101 TaxID=2774742 RepID=UPI003D2A56DE